MDGKPKAKPRGVGARIVIGEKVGALTVMDRLRKEGVNYIYAVHCADCGDTVEMKSMGLRQARSCAPCGWKRSSKNRVSHGDYINGGRSKLRGAWKGMMSRCYNKNHSAYRWYGGRGVGVCAEWHDFDVFKAWAMANGYAEGMTLDRITAEKDYGPDNCEYVTQSVNSKRMRAQYNFVRKESYVLPGDMVLITGADVAIMMNYGVML